ncbi:MAG: hypothetical protein ABSD29_21025 [Verrucomicrobiota bacterium]
MRRLPKSAVVVAGVCLVGLLVVSSRAALRAGYDVSDWLGWLDCVGEHPPTRYAPGFSEDRFAKVQRGMTREEVEWLLGAPLDKRWWPPWGCLWEYSEPGTNIPHYHQRDILFTPDGKVSQRLKHYFNEDYLKPF